MPDSTAIANEEPITITGFTFDGSNSLDIFLQISGASGISGTKPYRYVMVGDNMFRNGSNSSSNGAITAANANNDGQIRGVIYHNTFDRINVMLRIFSDNDTREWANTAFNQFSYGTEDNLYFEDNTISIRVPFPEEIQAGIESGQGGEGSLPASTLITWRILPLPRFGISMASRTGMDNLILARLER